MFKGISKKAISIFNYKECVKDYYIYNNLIFGRKVKYKINIFYGKIFIIY